MMKCNSILSEKGTINTVFIFKWLQEEYHVKRKMLYIICRPEITFDRVPKNVLECAMKKGIIHCTLRLKVKQRMRKAEKDKQEAG